MLAARPAVVAQAATTVDRALAAIGPDMTQTAGWQQVGVVGMLLHAALAVTTILATVVVTLDKATLWCHAVLHLRLRCGLVGLRLIATIIVAACLAQPIQKQKTTKNGGSFGATIVAVSIGSSRRGGGSDSRQRQCQRQYA